MRSDAHLHLLACTASELPPSPCGGANVPKAVTAYVDATERVRDLYLDMQYHDVRCHPASANTDDTALPNIIVRTYVCSADLGVELRSVEYMGR
jgi:hypothetical protein